jgi:hypothetical protein
VQGGDRRRAVARDTGDPLTEDPGGENGDDPRRTPFGAILAYVFTFLAILALLAYLLVALLRR